MGTLFKVRSFEKPDERKIVKADSIEKLIAGAIKKLKLEELKYKVYTDDFTEIDEDDILIDLAKAKETHGQELILTIVPEEIDWNKTSAQKNAPVQCSQQAEKNAVLHTKKSQAKDVRKVFNSLADDDDELFEKPKMQDEYGCVAYLPVRPPSEELKLMFKQQSESIEEFNIRCDRLTDEQLTSMKETYYPQRKDIHIEKDASVIFEQWPFFHLDPLLLLADDWNKTSAQKNAPVQCSQQAKKNGVLYKKKSQAKDVRKESDSLSDDDDELFEKPKMQDEYGCVAYLTVQPPSEELKLMLKQQSESIEEFNIRCDRLTDKQLTSMKETYYPQRKDIHIEKDASVIFEQWPFFHLDPLLLLADDWNKTSAQKNAPVQCSQQANKNGVLYKKKSQAKDVRKVSDSLSDDDDELFEKPKMQDEYGCVAYLTVRPPSEELKLMLKQQSESIEEFNIRCDRLTDEQLTSMKETYYPQRKDIHIEKDASVIFEQWPFSHLDPLLADDWNKTSAQKNDPVQYAVQCLQQAEKNAVHNKKKCQAKDVRKVSDSLADDDDELFEKPKMQDEYGCVAYLPVLPPSEKLKLMFTQQSELIEEFKTRGDELTDEQLTSMKETYYLQRMDIHIEKNLSEIFNQWPFFHHYEVIIQHADELLGKNTSSTWKESLQKLAKPINRWAENEEIAREVKVKNKKSALDEERRFVRDRLELATKYSKQFKNDKPYQMVVFEFIVKYMKEDSTFLYVLMSEDTEDEELLDKVTVANPVLVIRGQDLHAAENVYDIVINNERVIHATSFSEGLLTTFLCYYVFGVVYPQEIEGTLEAIQRLFLLICPPKGTKRGGERKATINPKVTKMTKDIDPYLADDWNKTSAQKNAPVQHAEVPNENVPTTPSNVRQATTNNSLLHSGATSPQSDHLSKIDPKFSIHIQTILSKGKNLTPKDRKEIVHTVRDYILYDLRYFSLGIAGAISAQLVSKYEKSFTTKIGSINGEIQCLKQAVYNAVHYKKKCQAKDVSKLSDSLADDDDELFEKPKMQDEYGCVAYLPVRPPSEELKLMFTQQSELKEEFNTLSDELTDGQLTSMKETYYLQRKDIHIEKTLSVIFDQWPFFHHYAVIIQHADELLGKNTSSTWKESLQKLAKPINRWAENEEIAREVKVKNKKSALDEERRFVRDRLELATKYSKQFKNDNPYQTVVFEFIVKYMKEDSTFLYILMSEDTEDEELLDKVTVANPILVIRGHDLHAAENLYDIVINKERLIHATSFSEGLLTTFLCYYVFGIVYPQEIEGTLEAIQRLFLLICPPKGTKRGGKRKATMIHPKVTKMTKDIDPYLADDWNKTSAQKNAPVQHAEVPNENVPTTPSNVRQATTNNSLLHSGATSPQSDHLSKIHPKFSIHIQTILSKSKNLTPKDRKEIVHTVRDYILYDLRYFSLGIAGAISAQLVSKYEKSFTTKIGSIDGEIQCLKQAVYNAVRYKKKCQAKDVSKLSDSLADDDDELFEKPKMQDEYGCVAYLPVRPPSEELKLMLKQQSELKEEFNALSDELTDEQLTSMKETYYLQRKDIHIKKDLSVIFDQWPFFHHYEVIIQHADELLGKNTSSTWKESLQKLAKPINRWAENEEIAREVKVKNKKSALDEERRFVRDRLELATKYSKQFKNDNPYQTVVFEFIVKYMKEDSTFLYILMSEDTEDEELLDKVTVANPVLVIRGQDLHAAENVYDIVIKKERVIHATSFSEGLLTTFLCYYVFGIVYPQEIEGTLEAIQRLFLLICPPKGTKRGGKRKATMIHPKVTKMTKDIDPYLADN